jgi:hypothetical protein
MKVVDNRKINTVSTFADLPIGQAYYDNNGLLCIKTSEYEENENCIVFETEDGWHADFESRSTMVRPVRTTLTIEG